MISLKLFFSEQNAVPIIQVENLKTDLKAGVDDLKHPEDIDNDALKMVMDYRARRDQIEDNVKQEEINIVDLSRELCQAKVQRKTQKGLHEEAIQKAQDFSVSSFPFFFFEILFFLANCLFVSPPLPKDWM